MRAFDEGDRAFGRMALAVMKYWICKRGAPFAAEALECLGGNGYIETQQAPVAQFYRDIQIGTVWEGSGNVIALDVLRAMAREPESVDAFMAECELGRAARTRASTRTSTRRARRSTTCARRARSSPPARWSRTWRWRCRRRCWSATGRRAVADAFCAARLAPTATARSGRSRAAWTPRRSWSERWRSDTQA